MEVGYCTLFFPRDTIQVIRFNFSARIRDDSKPTGGSDGTIVAVALAVEYIM